MNLPTLIHQFLAQVDDEQLAAAMRDLPDGELASMARNGAGSTLLRHALAGVTAEPAKPKPARHERGKAERRARAKREETPPATREGETAQRTAVAAALAKLGKGGAGVRSADVAELAGTTQAAASYHLCRLVADGKARHEGNRSASRFFVA
jgi:hypothetical protein